MIEREDRPVIILTTFWDANTIISNGYILYKHPEDQNQIYKINFISSKSPNKLTNYSVHSIAIKDPDISKLEHLKNGKMTRLDFLCPTYDLLNRYRKKEINWNKYKEQYLDILKSRKTNLKEWIESLVPHHVYILCCWENTISGANCHRQLIYEALINSKSQKNKVFPIYRHGNKISKKETFDYADYQQDALIHPGIETREYTMTDNVTATVSIYPSIPTTDSTDY